MLMCPVAATSWRHCFGGRFILAWKFELLRPVSIAIGVVESHANSLAAGYNNLDKFEAHVTCVMTWLRYGAESHRIDITA